MRKTLILCREPGLSGQGRVCAHTRRALCRWLKNQLLRKAALQKMSGSSALHSHCRGGDPPGRVCSPIPGPPPDSGGYDAPQSGGADGSRRKALPRIGRHVAAAATVQQRHSCLSDGDVGQTRRHHPLVHKVRKVVCKSDRAWRRCPWMFFSRKALFNSLLEAFPGLRLWDGHGSAPGRLAGERIGAAPRRPHPGRARIGEPGDTACHRPGCHRSTPCTGE